mmetsp:Transcript_27992/g.47586  ORF Transcript_27992/g.47586 Transcript_27992/m.47586 type:complete len:99 (+) Transcript_27992:546-842(+)
MKDQNIGRIPKSDQFQRADMLFAIGAIPRIVFIQLFTGGELIQAVFQGNGQALFRWNEGQRYGGVYVKFNRLLPAAGTRKMRSVHALRIIHKYAIVPQ